jgi:hypothetical protein
MDTSHGRNLFALTCGPENAFQASRHPLAKGQTGPGSRFLTLLSVFYIPEQPQRHKKSLFIISLPGYN